MLLVDYCEGTRSEWRLYEEAHLNLAYQWFCQLQSLRCPHHPTFPNIDTDVFETVVCFAGCSTKYCVVA
ncbi:transposase [Pseudomonas veronii]|nr:transposase [Pseudomonas veronii]